jgi:hypothetical protein
LKKKIVKKNIEKISSSIHSFLKHKIAYSIQIYKAADCSCVMAIEEGGPGAGGGSGGNGGGGVEEDRL